METLSIRKTREGREQARRLPLPSYVEQRARKAARTEAAVHLIGETGSGKTVLAKQLHAWSRRSDGPFVVVDCAAISGHLVEAEIFGHTKGAFTGARGSRAGLVREASGGTLFLDEFSVLPPESQSTLLRLVDERKVRPVGSDRWIEADVRVITASNEDVRKLVGEGRFRKDLMYRCLQLVIRLPPLHERADELPAIVDWLVRDLWKELGEPERTEVMIGEAAMKLLQGVRLRGNNRELRNVLLRAIIAADGGAVGPHHIEEALKESASTPWNEEPSEPHEPEDAPSRSRQGTRYQGFDTKEEERKAIVEALRKTGGNRTETARMLGMGRSTLYLKRTEHQIDEEEWNGWAQG